MLSQIEDGVWREPASPRPNSDPPAIFTPARQTPAESSFDICLLATLFFSSSLLSASLFLSQFMCFIGVTAETLQTLNQVNIVLFYLESSLCLASQLKRCDWTVMSVVYKVAVKENLSVSCLINPNMLNLQSKSPTEGTFKLNQSAAGYLVTFLSSFQLRFSLPQRWSAI